MNIAELRRLEAKPPLAWNIEDIVSAHNSLPELLRKAEAFDRIFAQGGEPRGGVDVG